jgi:CubicO group peptidase (beta-lactamase class C family)
MLAVEEGMIGLDDAAGQPGCTLRHLLAHAGGYGFDGPTPVTRPERRRIYSNTGIEMAADAVAAATAMSFAAYLTAGVLEPLGMGASVLRGSPAHGLHATVRDMTKLLVELQRPRLISPVGADEVTRIQYPTLTGIVPGVGRFDPCPWGLGVEIHGDKSPHWMGSTNSPTTFGHFGGAGTMMWVDPVAGRALVALTDRSFDDWTDAVESWRQLSDTVIAGGGNGVTMAAGGPAG